MIVPAYRLLLLAALAPGPLALAAAAIPAWAPFTGAAFLACAVLVLADALVSRDRLRGITLQAAPVVRLWKDRPGAVKIIIERPETGPVPGAVDVALALPAAFESPHRFIPVRLQPETVRSSFLWPLTPRRRGRYSLPLAALQTESVLGFWSIRRRTPLNSLLLVYPDILKDRKTLAGIFLDRGGVGIRKRRQVGRGREFARLRDYLPGDSLGDIHWKTTAKRGRPVTKEYQLERTQEVYAIIDSSRLSARIIEQAGAPDSGENTLEHYLRAALILGMVAQRQGDFFGLALFADRVRTFLRAGGGPAHFNACREAMYRAESELVSPDFRELFSFLRARLRRRALLVFLTDLDDPVLAEEFVAHIHLLTRRHLVLAVMVQPAGAVPVFSGAPVHDPSEIHERLAGHLAWRNLRALERALRRKGAGFALLPQDHLSLELISRYSDIKQRQLL